MARVVLTLGDDISTDIIYPGRFMATVLPGETPQHAFADNVEFNARLRKGEVPAGSIVVGGRNFGCGSSREQAASCLKGHELVIIARHFARIFMQNSINVGLRLVICPSLEAAEGDDLVIEAGAVRNMNTGKTYAVESMPAARQAIINAGGLIPYTRALLLASSRS